MIRPFDNDDKHRPRCSNNSCSRAEQSAESTSEARSIAIIILFMNRRKLPVWPCTWTTGDLQARCDWSDCECACVVLVNDEHSVSGSVCVCATREWSVNVDDELKWRQSNASRTKRTTESFGRRTTLIKMKLNRANRIKMLARKRL
jgi:hypothetical protein